MPTNSANEDKKSDWGAFAYAVLLSALTAIAVGYVGGGFLFYSYAHPISNLYDPEMASPLLNLNVISMLCQSHEFGNIDFSSDETSCVGNTKVGGAVPQPTRYNCPLPKPDTSVEAGSLPECEFPYTMYPGKASVNITLNHATYLWKKIDTEVDIVRKNKKLYLSPFWQAMAYVWGFGAYLYFWLPILGHNGKVPEGGDDSSSRDNKGGAYGVWVARTTASTWSSYRYILACLFTCSSSIKKSPTPYFKIQFVAYLYALLCGLLAESVIPLILPFLALVYLFSDYADQCTNEVAPGLTAGANVFYALISVPIITPMLGIITMLGYPYFAYLILIAPITKDKKLFLATLQCNQKFIGLVFATLVAAASRETLDKTTSGSLLGGYGILFLYYLYSNKEWFKGIINS
jgi:hypothetical protein